MGKTTNGAAAAAAPTLGAAARRLQENGYQAVSATMPWGWAVGQLDTPGAVFLEAPPAHIVSEHPAAVVCNDGLLALILRPTDDAEFGLRVRATLDRHKLTVGPCRFGSDGVTLWPLRFAGYDDALRKDLLDGVVTLERGSLYGQYGRLPALIPLDGAWPQGDLLAMSLDKLPLFDDDQMRAALRELAELPWQLKVEHRSEPRPSRLGWIGQ